MKKINNGVRFVAIASLVVVGFYITWLWVTLDAPGKLLIVKSGSMEPTIMTGSVVLSGPITEIRSPISSPRYAVGDVVTFTAKGNEFITHRITKITLNEGAYYYETKGDNNSTVDTSLVPENQIFGKVVWQVPFIGKIFAYTRQPFGFVTLVLIPALYVMGMEVAGLIGNVHHKRPTAVSLAEAA